MVLVAYRARYSVVSTALQITRSPAYHVKRILLGAGLHEVELAILMGQATPGSWGNEERGFELVAQDCGPVQLVSLFFSVTGHSRTLCLTGAFRWFWSRPQSCGSGT